MISVDAGRDLFRQMEWADAAVWRAVMAKPEIAADERVLVLLLHLHAVQRAFLLMWKREPVDVEALYAKRDAPALIAWARTYYPEAEAFMADAEPRLNELVEMPWLAHFEKQFGRPLHAPTLAETFVQVPMHSMYHRAQVNTRIRELGGVPAAVDFINWVWHGKPDPEW